MSEGIPGLPGPLDFVHGLNDLGHGITEGIGDAIDNGFDGTADYIRGYGNPGTDYLADVIDNTGSSFEAGWDGYMLGTGLAPDIAVAGLDQIGAFVGAVNDSLSNAGEHINAGLNGDPGAWDAWVEGQQAVNAEYGHNATDVWLDGPLGPAGFTENYFENDFNDWTEGGADLGEQIGDFLHGSIDDYPFLTEPPIGVIVDLFTGDLDPSELFGPLAPENIDPSDLPTLPEFDPDWVMMNGGGSGGPGDLGGLAAGILGGMTGGLFNGGSGGAGGAWQGMNVDAVKAAAQQLLQQASRIRELAGKVDGELSTLVGSWHGQDAQKYAQVWQGQYRPALIKGADIAEHMAQTAMQQVGKQQSTSNA